jgi:hypothetical protein
MRMALVTDDSPFTIQFGGDSALIPTPSRLDSYTPTINDNVLVACWDSNLVVLGKVV